MSTDRSVRCLSQLSGASSSRVLNLTAIGLGQLHNDAHGKKPLFQSPVLNNAIILKHRLRADEVDLFTPRRLQATKIIIPFERTNLKAGGQSMFIDQRGFEQLLEEVGHYKNSADMKRDLFVLRIIDHVSSLDPFLLREQMRSNAIDADPTYFEISGADQARMFDYTAAEIGRLTALVDGRSAEKAAMDTSRMVSALLSSEVNERLEPLRATLKIGPEEFREGVFSWRGFIFYKWSLSHFWPNLIKCLREVKSIAPIGRVEAAQSAFFSKSRIGILQGTKYNSDKVRKILSVYDDAYASLIDRHDPGEFRDFLLSAPKLFLEIGEKMGSIIHLTSFWQYRFPAGSPKSAAPEELAAIYEDFMSKFA
jgi:hypothetical protein